VDPAIPFLKKPVSLPALAFKVRDVLNSTRAISDWQELLQGEEGSEANFAAGMAVEAMTPRNVNLASDDQV